MRQAIRRHFLLLLLLHFLIFAPSLQAALRIEILRGEGANNNVLMNMATSPVVRVLDDNGPVAGALVVFTAPDDGATVEFSGSGWTGEAVTDQSGAAASPRVKPAGANGPVNIRVMASKNGELVNRVIHQMNLGIGETAARDGELDIVQLPAVPAEGSRRLILRVRVDDGRGQPVANASLVLALRRIDKSGKAHDLWSAEAVSDKRGEAEHAAAKPPSGVRLELVVRAELGIRRATRYFPLPPIQRR